MSNRKSGVYDSGATGAGVEEATVAMEVANDLRKLLQAAGHKVVRTRVDAKDPAPVSQRAVIAKNYKGDIMLSIHCNAANGKASGSECIYRGPERKTKAAAISKACSAALGIKDRGPKVEADSQHGKLAVMAFQPTYLLELGFIDNEGDRAAMLDPVKRKAKCVAVVNALLA